MAPLRSMIALVASVVPWMISDRSPGAMPASASTAPIAASTPAPGASRVVRILVLHRRSPCSRATSVKVPPISTPSRASARPFGRPARLPSFHETGAQSFRGARLVVTARGGLFDRVRVGGWDRAEIERLVALDRCRARQLAGVPTAPQRLDQRDAGDELALPDGQLALGVGERGLFRDDDRGIGLGSGEVLVVDDALGLARGSGRAGGGLCLLGKDAQGRELILDRLERGQYGLPVIGDGLVESARAAPPTSPGASPRRTAFVPRSSRRPRMRLPAGLNSVDSIDEAGAVIRR